MMTGMLKCRLCGKNLTGRYNKNRTRQYICKNRKDHGIAGCELPYLNVEEFDERFLKVILDDLLAPENVLDAIDQIKKQLSGPYEQQAATVLALEDQIRKAEDRRGRVMAAYEDSAYSVSDLAKRMEPLRHSQDELLTKKVEAERLLDQQAAVVAQPEMVLNFAREVGEFIKHSTAQERKQVLLKFIKCVWIEPGRGRVVYSVPLPRDAGKSKHSETELALDEEPVRPSTLLSPHSRG